jgi:predicted dehydrogenase
MPIQWGLAGPGKIADQIVQDLKEIDKQFLGVASRDRARAELFAAEHGIERVYENYDAMFSDSDIDAIYISTINTQHFPIAKKALQAGKHVLVEKPFTLNATQAVELYEIANSNSLLVMEALWSRFLDHWLELPKIIEALGGVSSIEADFSVNISHVQRLTELELGGGALLDLGVYPLSMIQMLLGKAERVSVEGETQKGVDKNLKATLSYPNQTEAVFTTGFDSDGPVTATIRCSAGRIEIANRFYEMATLQAYNAEGEVIATITPDHPGRGMQQQFVWFEKALGEGRLELENFTQRDSLDVLEMMDDIRNQLGVVYPGE